jgi:hypothetical protein
MPHTPAPTKTNLANLTSHLHFVANRRHFVSLPAPLIDFGANARLESFADVALVTTNIGPTV